MSELAIPHIHKIEGKAGFWAEVTKKGEVHDLKINTLLGLRQIEGILIGRRFWEVPLMAARICGICPVVHVLNCCTAIENAFNLTVSETVILLRKLILASQIIQSHTLHLFFMTLADFSNIENDFDVLKRFPKEAKASLAIRDFSLKATKIIGGRAIHPMSLRVGGFTVLPKKENLAALANDYPAVLESALILAKLFKKLDYPVLERKTEFLSTLPKNEYPLYRANEVLIAGKTLSAGDFYSNQIEEDLKNPPVKKVKYQGKPYLLGAIARIKNRADCLNPRATEILAQFQKERAGNLLNVFYNPFYQAVEVVHFLEETEKLIKVLKEKDFTEAPKEFKINKGSGLSAMEAPRGTLFTYIEVGNDGRVLDCNIITPTAQFLYNLEEDLKAYLPQIAKFSQKEKVKKIRALVRVYDPCISCATQ